MEKVLYLSPGVGFHRSFNSFDRSISKTNNFKINKASPDPDFEVYLRLESRKWLLSGGFSVGDVSYGIAIHYVNGAHSRGGGTMCSRFPLMLSYKWKEVRFLEMDQIWPNRKNRNLYLLAFDMQPTIGFSINRFGNYKQTHVADSSSFITSPYIINTTVKRITNFSFLVGMGFQFYNYKGTPSANIFIFYSKGFYTLQDVNVKYDIGNNHLYQTLIHQRGTIIGIQLSYFIKLKTFNRNKGLN